MTVWWYFKNSKYCTIDDQTSAARSIKYDTESSEDWWLQHPRAKREYCNNILRLIADEKYKKRPVKRGDTLWVYDMFCLASQNGKIRDIITTCHESGVHLCIYRQKYKDFKRPDGTNDFDLLYGVLTAFIDRSALTYTRRKRVGAPSRGLQYSSLPREGKEIIKHYQKRDGMYTREAAMRAIQTVLPDKKPIGKDTFYRLLKEHRKLTM